MSIEPDNELQLLDRVRRGDAMAMRAVYSAHIRYLAAVCSRYVSNDEDVKDVLQESFLKIFSGIDSFEYRGRGSLRGWMTRVMLNEALKFLRRGNRLQFVEMAVQAHDFAEEEPDVDAMPAAVLFALIRELPAGYRTVFNLYAIENKSHKEIAAMLHIKESTSASQLHRAKALLVEKIRQYNHKHS